MNLLTSEDLKKVLEEIKFHLHDMNRLFFINTPLKKSLITKKVRVIWTLIHDIRTENEFLDKEPYISLQKIAGQLGRMDKILMQNEFQVKKTSREFMILRGFVEQYEKKLAALFYYQKTEIHASKMISLQETADLIGKSEVTARRYVHSGKILGIQLTRKYWIALEELIPYLEKEDEREGK